MTPDSKASDVEARELEAFKAAFPLLKWHVRGTNSYFFDSETDATWKGWLARASQQPSAQWIACSERMPEADQQVWVWLRFSNGSEDQGYAIWTGIDWFLDVSESGSLIARQTAIQEGLDAADVTHWQPLPHSPDAERTE